MGKGRRSGNIYNWEFNIDSNYKQFQKQMEQVRKAIKISIAESLRLSKMSKDEKDPRKKKALEERAYAMREMKTAYANIKSEMEKVNSENIKDLNYVKQRNAAMTRQVALFNEIYRTRMSAKGRQDVKGIMQAGANSSSRYRVRTALDRVGPTVEAARATNLLANAKRDNAKAANANALATQEEARKAAENTRKTNENTDAENKNSKAKTNGKKKTDDSTRSTKRRTKANQGLASSFKKILTWSVAAFGVHRLTAYVTRGITSLYELDKELTQISTVTGKTRKEVYELGNEFNRMGTRLGKTTKEIASASVIFFRQGKSQAEVLKLVEATTVAASVANTDMAQTSEYLTATLNGFKMEASEAMDIVDKFSAIGANAGTSFSEVAYALTKVGSSAQNAGVDIDHMMSYIATVSEVTRESAENIGTSFKTMFARMRKITSNPTGTALKDLNNVEKALKSVNIRLRSETTGQIRDLQDVIGDLGGKWASLTRNQQAYVATAVAGSRQQSRFISLMDNYERSLQILSISQDSAGAGSVQFAAHLKGLEAAVSKAKATFEDFWLTLLDEKTLTGAVNGFTELLKVLQSLSELGFSGIAALIISLALFGRMVKSIWIMEGFTAAATGGSVALRAFAQTAASSLNPIAALTGVLAKLKAVIIAFSVSNPLIFAVTLITAAVIALTTGLKYLEKRRVDAIVSSLEMAKALSLEAQSAEKLTEEYRSLYAKTERTAEETERLKSLQEKIYELNPKLVESYDEYGNAIIKSKNAVKELNDELEKGSVENLDRALGKAEKDLRKLNTLKDKKEMSLADIANVQYMKDSGEFSNSEIASAMDASNAFTLIKDSYGTYGEELEETIGNFDTLIKEATQRAYQDYDSEISSMLDNVSNKLVENGNPIIGSLGVVIGRHMNNELELGMEAFQKEILASGTHNSVQEYGALIVEYIENENTEALNEMVDLLNSSPGHNANMANLNNVLSGMFREKLENSGASKEITQSLMKTINKAFIDLKKDKIQFSEIADILNFDKGKIKPLEKHIKEYQRILASFGRGDISAQQARESINALREMIIALMGTAASSEALDDLFAKFEKFSNDSFSEDSAQQFANRVGAINADIDETIEELMDLNELIEDGANISADAASEFLKDYPEMHDAVSKVGDQHKINTEIVKEHMKTLVEADAKVIEQEINETASLTRRNLAWLGYGDVALSTIESIASAQNMINQAKTTIKMAPGMAGPDGLEPWINDDSVINRITEADANLDNIIALKKRLASLRTDYSSYGSDSDGGKGSGVDLGALTLQYEDLKIEEFKNKIKELDAQIENGNLSHQQRIDLLNEKKKILLELSDIQRSANLLPRQEDMNRQAGKLNEYLNSQNFGVNLELRYNPDGTLLLDDAFKNNLQSIEDLYNNLAASGSKKVAKSIEDLMNPIASLYKEIEKTSQNINQNAKSIEGANNKIAAIHKERVEAYKKAEETIKEMYEKELENKLEAYDRDLEEFEEYIDDKLNLIQKEQDERERIESQNEDIRDINEIKQKMGKLALDDSIEARNKYSDLQKELTEKESKMASEAAKYETEKRKESLEESKENYGDWIESQKDLLNEMYSTEQIAIKTTKALQTGYIDWLDGKRKELIVTFEEFYDKNHEGITTTGKLLKDELIDNLLQVREIVQTTDLTGMIHDSRSEMVEMAQYASSKYGATARWDPDTKLVDFIKNNQVVAEGFSSDDFSKAGLKLNTDTWHWEGMADDLMRFLESIGLGYDKGGPISGTGMIAAHGSKRSSEVMFDAANAKKLYDYVLAMPTLTDALSGGRRPQPTTGGQQNIVMQVDNLLNVEGNVSEDTMPDIQELSEEVYENLRVRITTNGI